jgi:glycosyltransferase involved in cell wall biosynthesis
MQQLPLVSVVIPMRNEAAHICKCIDSVLAQDYPADRLEVIVVDGDSDDDSAAALRAYGPRLQVLRNPAGIVPTAMNIGIRAARGEIIARVDAHTILDPAYVRSGVETLRRTGADNVGGPMHSVGGGRVGNAIALAMSSRFGIGAYFHFATDDREVDTVYMGMYPRAVFERIGLFDEELVRNQDDELNYRLRKAGGRIFLTTRMRSRYQNRQSFRTLAKQFFQYGVWKIRVLQKHPRQMRARQFVPPLFVAALVVTGAAAPWMPAAAWMFLAIVLAYWLTVTAAATTLVRRQGWGNLPMVIAAFATMHCSWGSGFLLGVWRFAHRWFGAEPLPPRLEAVQSSFPVPGAASVGWRRGR